MAHIDSYPGYPKKKRQWQYAQDVYDGTAFDYYEDGKTVYFNSIEARKYFPKKTQRESEEAYKERLKLIDPAVYYGTAIDSMIGILSASEAKAQRTFSKDGQGLGDPTDPTSKAWNLLNNVDGNGGSYMSLPKNAGTKLATKLCLYGLVEGVVRNADGEVIGGSTIKILDPDFVTKKIEKNGRLIACRVLEKRDETASLNDVIELTECYTDYTLEGWKRYEVEGNVLIDEGDYKYYSTSEKNENDLILPIFKIELMLDRPVGYIWAKKCIAIANAESQLDHAHRNVSFQLFKFVGSAEQFEEAIKTLNNGSNIIRQEPDSKNEHDFIAPSSEFFEAAETRIKERIVRFFHGMFKDYGDAAQDKTATEIRLESQTGIESFLTYLATALDEFENNALFRYSQAELPDQPQFWGDARVTRPLDFTPVDVDAIAEKLSNRYVTGMNTVPTDSETMASILAEIFKSDGINAPDQSVLNTLAEQYINSKTQERDLTKELGL